LYEINVGSANQDITATRVRLYILSIYGLFPYGAHRRRDRTNPEFEATRKELPMKHFGALDDEPAYETCEKPRA
jgi:hypothetical protein